MPQQCRPGSSGPATPQAIPQRWINQAPECGTVDPPPKVNEAAEHHRPNRSTACSINRRSAEQLKIGPTDHSTRLQSINQAQWTLLGKDHQRQTNQPSQTQPLHTDPIKLRHRANHPGSTAGEDQQRPVLSRPAPNSLLIPC